MCKNVVIEFTCDRCGHKVEKQKNPKLGFTLVNRYPAEFRKIGEYNLCVACANEYEASFQKFMKEGKGKHDK